MDKKSFLEKHFNIIVLIILLSALILRILALLSLKGTIYFDDYIYDESIYHLWGEKIALNTWKSETIYRFAPLYAYIIAFIYKLFSPDILYIRILNIIFGTLACFFIFLAAKNICGKKVAIIALILSAVYKPFIFYSIILLKASFALMLFSAIVYLFFSWLKKRSIYKLLGVGLLIGFMINVRPQIMITIPLFLLLAVLFDYKQKRVVKVVLKNSLIFFTGLLIAVFPFTLRNYLVANNATVSTEQGGFNFYMASSVVNPTNFANTDPRVQGIQYTIEASRRAGKKLSPQEASKFWYLETLKMIREYPLEYLKKIGIRFLLLFKNNGAIDHYNIGFMSKFILFFKFPFLSFVFILSLAICGIVYSVRRSNKFLALALILITYSSSLIIFYNNNRFKLPVISILIIFAAIGIYEFISYIKQSNYSKVLLFMVPLLAGIVMGSLPVKYSNDLSGYYNARAISLYNKKRISEAVDYWKKSSKSGGVYSNYADIALASLFYANDGVSKVDQISFYLNKVRENRGASPLKYKLLGNIYRDQKDWDKAVFFYEKVLSINSGEISVIKELIQIFNKIDKKKAAKKIEMYNYIKTFY